MKTLEIKGVDFENFTAAVAHLSQGMPVSEVCEILEVDLSTWQTIHRLWYAKLAVMMKEDIEVSIAYGDIFAFPNVGKFSNSISAIAV